MRNLVIPETFFKTLADKPKLYIELWFKWLSDYADDVLEPFFLEKISLSEISRDEIKEIWILGVQLLRQGNFSIVKAKKGKTKEKISEAQMQIIVKTVEYLNHTAGTSFLPSTKSTINAIFDRISEGFNLLDFKKVIDNKVLDWKGTPHEIYLRPITLFSEKKFENYLNERQSFKSDNQASTTGFSKGNAANEKLQQFSSKINSAKQSFIINKQ